MKKTAIFIDYDNVYDTIDKKYNTDNTIDIHINFIEKIWDKFKEDNILKFIAFGDFSKINKNHLITELQKRSVKLEHCYSNGLEEKYRKNASDLALCISVIKSLYEKDYDKYVLISSDCDMIPILNELKFKNKETIHIFSPTSANKDIKEYDKEKSWSIVNDFYSLEDILGVEVYENESKDLGEETLKDILFDCLEFVFNNIVDQRKKENIYGFGYLVSDIMKGTKKVKQDALEIAKQLKDQKVILVIGTTESKNRSFENFRLNKENEWVKEYFSDKISSGEYDDIFVSENNLVKN